MGIINAAQQQTHNLKIVVWSGALIADIPYLGYKTPRAQGFLRETAPHPEGYFFFSISSSLAEPKWVVMVLDSRVVRWRQGWDYREISKAPALGTTCERFPNKTKQNQQTKTQEAR